MALIKQNSEDSPRVTYNIFGIDSDRIKIVNKSLH